MIPMIAPTIFWVAVVVCVIAHRFILRSAFAAGNAVQHSHTLPPIRKAAEVLWVILPALTLVVLLVATWRAIEARKSLPLVPSAAVQTVTT
jgi:heme/copper-type cytochrome/quinol oxidase subunit 2